MPCTRNLYPTTSAPAYTIDALSTHREIAGASASGYTSLNISNRPISGSKTRLSTATSLLDLVADSTIPRSLNRTKTEARRKSPTNRHRRNPSTTPTARESKSPPRPPNSFIIFRSHYYANMQDLPTGTSVRQTDLSANAADEWNIMSEDEKLWYRQEAARKKAEYEELLSAMEGSRAATTESPDAFAQSQAVFPLIPRQVIESSISLPFDQSKPSTDPGVEFGSPTFYPTEDIPSISLGDSLLSHMGWDLAPYPYPFGSSDGASDSPMLDDVYSKFSAPCLDSVTSLSPLFPSISSSSSSSILSSFPFNIPLDISLGTYDLDFSFPSFGKDGLTSAAELGLSTHLLSCPEMQSCSFDELQSPSFRFL